MKEEESRIKKQAALLFDVPLSIFEDPKTAKEAEMFQRKMTKANRAIMKTIIKKIYALFGEEGEKRNGNGQDALRAQ